MSNINVTACLKWTKYNLFSKKIPFDITISMPVQSKLCFPQHLPLVQMQYETWSTFRNVFPLHLFGLPLCVHDSAPHNSYCRFLETFTPCILWYLIQYWKQNGLNDKSKHLKLVGKFVFNTNRLGFCQALCCSQENALLNISLSESIIVLQRFVSEMSVCWIYHQIIETKTVHINGLNFLFNYEKKKVIV